MKNDTINGFTLKDLKAWVDGVPSNSKDSDLKLWQRVGKRAHEFIEERLLQIEEREEVVDRKIIMEKDFNDRIVSHMGDLHAKKIAEVMADNDRLAVVVDELYETIRKLKAEGNPA
jgi:hypothetical protein